MTDKKCAHRADKAGKLIVDNALANIDLLDSCDEILDEMNKDYAPELEACIDRGKKQFGNQDFFVSILIKPERLLRTAIRFYYVPRLSCPTPTFDQIVYKYHHKKDMVEFIWVIPSRQACKFYTDNPLKVPVEERDLLNYVLDFYDGALDERCRKLNNEKIDSPRVVIKVNE